MEWQPIETAPKNTRNRWLANSGNMRIGFWAEGSQHEALGSVGGGWIDFFLAEAGGPRGLRFQPTHWMPLPLPPAPTDPAP